jgi:hypothetical protein
MFDLPKIDEITDDEQPVGGSISFNTPNILVDFFPAPPSLD